MFRARRLLHVPVLIALVVGCGSSSATTPGASVTGAGSGSSTDADLTVVFLGDSYTAESVDGGGYVPAVADELGWHPVLAAVGGTGYLTAGAQPGGAPYRDRVPEVVAARPDLVVVQGSTNDVDVSPSALRIAAGELYRRLEDELPKARIVVLGPLAPPAVDAVAMDGLRDALSEAAERAGIPYVDPIAQGWLSPPEGLFADPVHPNDVGYDELADDLVESLRQLGF